MAKCRMLIQENQELGRQLSQGRIAQLEAELALQKKYSEELKSSQDELNDFIIQLDEEVEGMQSTILVLQQQLRETRQQLSQMNQTQGTSSGAGPSRTSPSTASEPSTQSEPANASSSNVGKDCGRVSNGPSNGNSSQRGASGSSLYREASSADEDYPPSPSVSSPTHDGISKLSNHSEDAVSQRGGEGYVTQLSAGYESVDSPTGSETSVTQHSNDTDSNADSHEAAAVPKGSRTAGTRHSTQNGLDSSAAAVATNTSNASAGSVL
ncbi:pre-mRNA-splicing regulator WTAP isoform X2 [Danio rerio]|nr:pre-mRNA-splicing regulator WTAP isoform X1 [Danio rerio]XP_005160693.1 pre-mRNA-splicing regulator WTAP isoform X1 [Danio rerio]|eukprot:XP_005160692.1 pre-mRNA-splicing regulator WTAP isoform X1 [Danio rerio]